MLVRGKDVQPPGAQCDKCTLRNQPYVEGYGPKQADVVLCGEAPGPTEARRGLPFVGRAGQLLDAVLQDVGLEREELFVTNACLCAPEPIRAPTTKELRACRTRLLQTVKARKPKVVVAMGNTALKAITDRHGISNWQGAPIWSEELQTVVVPSFHPAAVLRSPRRYQDLKTALKKAVSVLKGEIAPAPPTGADVDTVIIQDTNGVGKLIERLNQLSEVALDVETASDGSLLCIGFSWKPSTAVVVTRDALVNPVVLEGLNHALGRLKIIGQNLKFDLQVLWRHGITKARTGADTMLEHYTMNEIPGTHGLTQLVKNYLNVPEYDAELKPYLKKGFEHLDPETLWEYNAKDVSYTYQLHELFQERLDANNRQVLRTLLYPASDVLARMESLGVLVDVPTLDRLDQQYTAEIDTLIKQLHTTAGREFNPNSYKQLLQLLYTDLELPIPGRLSTDKAALTEIREFHPIVDMLLQYRAKKKLHSTYVVALKEAADVNGRVHTTFNLHGTVTGRLSSSNPVNLQNIPRDSDIRRIFVATPGYTLVEGDLSQAEIRGLAYYSRDENLLNAIRAGGDMHVRNACLMFGTEPEQVSKDMREKAKRLNFAVLYQMSATTLAHELGVSEAEATSLIEKYFSAFPQAKEWIEHTKQQALETGQVATPFGRVRRFGFIGSNRNDVLRQAVNAPIQSLASDITLSALIRAGKHLEGNNDTRLLLTVHDSILLETCEDPMEIALWLRDVMEAPVLDGSVPFVADVSIGRTWGDLVPIGEYKKALLG